MQLSKKSTEIMNNNTCVWQPYCPEASLSHVKMQMFFTHVHGLTVLFLSSWTMWSRCANVPNSCFQTFLLHLGKAPCEALSCTLSLLLLSVPLLPIPYQWRFKEPQSCCFSREWFYGFELSFKTPRLHISTPFEIVSLC